MTTSFEQRVIDACDRFLAARDRFVTEILGAARDASIEAIERSFALATARRSRLVRAPHNDEPEAAEVAPALPDPATAPMAELTPLPMAMPPEPAPAATLVRIDPGLLVGTDPLDDLGSRSELRTEIDLDVVRRVGCG